MAHPDPPNQSRRFFTIEEVARELRVSVDTVRRLIRRGKLGCVQVTARIRRIPREALDLYVRKELRRGETLW